MTGALIPAWTDSLVHRAAGLAPAPGTGGLRVRVTCRTSQGPGSGHRHDVVVHEDWSVTTPHDLDSERVAAALGGYLSCLGLVDASVPALRTWLLRASRLTVLQLATDPTGRWWRAALPLPCCPRRGFASMAAAADHVRSVAHVARECEADPRQLQVLVRACRVAYEGDGGLSVPEPEASVADRACLRGRADVTALWEAGVHPAVVVGIHEEVGTTQRLPARFYTGVVTRRPDLRWVADTLAAFAAARSAAGHADQHSPWDTDPGPGQPPASADAVEPSTRDGDLASWVAWSHADWDLADPTARGRWLSTGITPELILVLGEAGYDPAEVLALAREVGRPADAMARTLRDWLRAGFTPRPVDLLELFRGGIPSYAVPSATAVSAVRSAAGRLADRWSPTELALLLAERGTVADSVAALRRGDLVSAVAAGDDRPTSDRSGDPQAPEGMSDRRGA